MDAHSHPAIRHLVLLTEEATVFAIRQLADTAAQRVFADFGAFMLERTVKSLVDFDDSVEQREVAVPREKVLSGGQLSSTSLH
jgi:hypothetical protein